MADAARHRAGEGALLVAEELGFQQVSGIAAQLMETNGFLARLERVWTSRAIIPCRCRIRR